MGLTYQVQSFLDYVSVVESPISSQIDSVHAAEEVARLPFLCEIINSVVVKKPEPLASW